MQDMYRRTLASSWAAQVGELPADECIESIFAGGTGWRNQAPPSDSAQRHNGFDDENDSGSRSEDDRRKDQRRQKASVSRTGPKGGTKARPLEGPNAQRNDHDSTESGSSSQHDRLHIPAKARRASSTRHEIDEYEAREDLRSWRLPMTG